MKKNGFTLIELLVTMGIIAVLAGMAVFNFNQARMRARDVQRKSDLGQLQKSLELYRNDNNGRYPATLDQSALIASEYLKVGGEIEDPKGVVGGWYDYTYTVSIDLKTYTIRACLENKTDSTKLLPTVTCPPVSLTGVIYQVTNP